MTIKENEDNTMFIVLISIVATIGGFLFGFDSGVSMLGLGALRGRKK
ncbi:hypothetical protein N9F42_04390 [Pseudomonadales bacterium]|nr:hypothetical protein [Pseudomonadales bacterium]